jgi:hypothetical protein
MYIISSTITKVHEHMFWTLISFFSIDSYLCLLAFHTSNPVFVLKQIWFKAEEEEARKSFNKTRSMHKRAHCHQGCLIYI